VPIDENSETIEINFSHTFAVRNRQLFLTAYADKAEIRLDQAPIAPIQAAISQLYKRYPKAMLAKAHIEAGDVGAEE
jgi:hypothetical protein